jgi:hypothetical protein
LEGEEKEEDIRKSRKGKEVKEQNYQHLERREFTKYFRFSETRVHQSEVLMAVLCLCICMGDSNSLYSVHPFVIMYQLSKK